MSKVDLTVFEELLEEFSVDGSLGHFVYQLASGDLEIEFDDLPYPSSNGRKHNDPAYQAEYEAWNEVSTSRHEALLAKAGYEHLEQDGGGEGNGEYCYGIFKLAGKVYKAEYSYYSHHGHDYDDIESTLREVTPVQKTIVVWE